MRRSIKLVSAVSFLSLTAGVAMAAVVNKVDCEIMGYTTPLEECKAAGGTPLFCPFFDAKNNQKTLCLTKSCRGYPLVEADLDSPASDGQKIRAHVESYDTCTTSPLEGSITYYKIVKCKNNSLYQNNICDVGCLAERYPYDSHQGNIAGDMQRCDDGVGEHYGYETCNEGWEGGWAKNRTGRCELASCDVKSFPYVKDPNITYNRGTTKQCMVGGNPYYRYSLTDIFDNPSDEACGVVNDYTLINAVCQKECVFSNCTKSIVNQTLSGLNFSYNDWSCKMDTEDCRVGDLAIFNINGDNVVAGVITHFPSASNNKVNVMANTSIKAQAYPSGGVRLISLPTYTYSRCREDQNGKYNTNFMFAYKAANPQMRFPAYSKIAGDPTESETGYAPEGCPDNSVCGKGEWYMASCGELYDIYKERHIFYNIYSMNNKFIKNISGSSTQHSETYNLGVEFSGGTSPTGYSDVYAYSKDNNETYYPLLGFYLK